MEKVFVLFCVCLCVGIVSCQFGFFPQREDRRYGSMSVGFNFLPDTRRITEKLTGILNFRPNNQNTNQGFFPFRRPAISTEQRPPEQYGNYPNQNADYNPYMVYGQNNGNQGNFIAFPTTNPNERPVNFVDNNPVQNNDNQPTAIADQNNYENPPVPVADENNYNNQPVTVADQTNDGNQPAPVADENDKVNFSDEDRNDNKPAGIPNVLPTAPVEIPNNPPPLAPADLPELQPVPESEKRNNFNFGTAGLFQETCETVDKSVGTCIVIQQCQPYYQQLKTARSNPDTLLLLRRAHCGFEGTNPKVCCPHPAIPSELPTTTTTTTTTTLAPVLEPEGTTGNNYVEAFPEPPICGVSNASFSRVVGGVNAKLGDFPWMALLGYKSRRSPNARWLCGGSLVSRKHVLTAAHCIHGKESDLYIVRLGELDIEKEDEGATPVDVMIKEKIKHEEYSPEAFTNDIGLLLLDHDIAFTDLIKPICIPKDSELRARSFENYNPIIAGWGDTEFRGPSATHLQALQLPVVSNDYCVEAYSKYTKQQIDERVLCAGFKQGGKDACQGDSGGPLMQPIWNDMDYTTHFYQIGVVSFGRRCAEAGFPGVYSRVTHFVPWLQEKMMGANRR